jgi:flagellar hook-length control protein FliK
VMQSEVKKAPVEVSADTQTTDPTPVPGSVSPAAASPHAPAVHLSSSHALATTSTQRSAVPAAHSDAVEVAHQIGRHIATSRLSSLTREHPMHLSVLLHPEDLGEVSVQLTLVSGRIDVQVSSQSDSTRDMLRQGMQDLRRQLSDSGVSVGDMDVRDGWSQQSNSSQNSADNADQRSSQQSRLADRTATPTSRMTTPEPNVVHRPSRTGIDILA